MVVDAHSGVAASSSGSRDAWLEDGRIAGRGQRVGNRKVDPGPVVIVMTSAWLLYDVASVVHSVKADAVTAANRCAKPSSLIRTGSARPAEDPGRRDQPMDEGRGAVRRDVDLPNSTRSVGAAWASRSRTPGRRRRTVASGTRRGEVRVLALGHGRGHRRPEDCSPVRRSSASRCTPTGVPPAGLTIVTCRPSEEDASLPRTSVAVPAAPRRVTDNGNLGASRRRCSGRARRIDPVLVPAEARDRCPASRATSGRRIQHPQRR